MQHLVCKESEKKCSFSPAWQDWTSNKHQQEWSLGTGTPQLDPTGRSSESSALMLGNIWFNIFNPQSSRSGRRSLVKRKVGRQRSQPVDSRGWIFGISDGHISPADQQLTSKIVVKTWWFQMIQHDFQIFKKQENPWRCEILQPFEAEVTWLAVLWMWRKMEQVGTLWWAMDWWIEACWKKMQNASIKFSPTTLTYFDNLGNSEQWALQNSSASLILNQDNSSPSNLTKWQRRSESCGGEVAKGGTSPISHVAARSAMRFCFCVFFEEYGPPVTRPWTAVGSYCVRRPQNSVLRTLGHWNFCVLRCGFVWKCCVPLNPMVNDHYPY